MPDADPYVYPGTDVLRNKFNIRDADRLRVVEANVTGPKIAELRHHRLDGRYDLAHLRRFHREIFSSLYPWAGEIRSVYIAKAQLFAAPQYITPYLGDQLARLGAENHLRGLDQSQFVERATYYLAEVNAVHPFREGNGRTQRAFFGQLAHDAGYEIAWDRLDPDRNIEASIASLDGDNSKLQEQLSELVEVDGARIDEVLAAVRGPSREQRAERSGAEPTAAVEEPSREDAEAGDDLGESARLAEDLAKAREAAERLAAKLEAKAEREADLGESARLAEDLAKAREAAERLAAKLQVEQQRPPPQRD
jgi:cell filamentation protein